MGRHHKKASKKLAKALKKVAKDLNVIYHESNPSEWLILWGVGLLQGTDKRDILKYLPLEPSEIRYFIGKPYTLVRYPLAKDCSLVRRLREHVPFFGKSIYFAYIHGVPPPESETAVRLFKTPWPKGLYLLTDFISLEEERELMTKFVEPNLQAPKTIYDFDEVDEKGNPINKLRHRAVRHFGYEFRYATNDVNVYKPMKDEVPIDVMKYISRMMKFNVYDKKPDQLTINYYGPGHGIPSHIDTHSVFERTIVSLSLGNPTVMDFKNGAEQLSLVLPPRSLLILRDEARYLWTHGIAARTYDITYDAVLGLNCVKRLPRVSLTFRAVNKSRICKCLYPEKCDYQIAISSKDFVAYKIERDLVHRVYKEIADHFSKTRHTPWPKVKDFIKQIAPGSTFLDAGCGNGKYFNLTDHIYQIGLDMSEALIEISKENHKVDAIHADVLEIPFGDKSFDAIISIAVLHHLASRDRRLKALKEIYRVMAVGGKALIYVWAKDQKFKEVKSVYARQQALKAGRDPDEICHEPPKDYSFLPVYNHEENFKFNDMLVPWIKKGGDSPQAYHRFYHVFNKGELEELLSELSPPPHVVDSYYDQGNWCVQFIKPEKELEVLYKSQNFDIDPDQLPLCF